MTISAGLGIATFNFDDVRGFWSWVELCDAEGVDSIWQSDRLISDEPMLECMSLMAALAGATRRIKFGMNVASMALRDPVVTAKACATIDLLSEGRLLPAFGVGTARGRDYAATGRSTRGRGERSGEAIAIISRLWTEQRVSFNGKYFRLKDATISPRPVQNPLPLWVGGSAPPAVKRTARWGTGWQAGIETPAQIEPVIAAIKAEATAIGRRIDDDHFGAGFGFRFGSEREPVSERYLTAVRARVNGEPHAYCAIGGADDIMARMAAFREAGVHKFILRPIAAGTEDMLAQTRRFIAEVVPRVRALNG
jgi:probable F420-dependent oxidoreductase